MWYDLPGRPPMPRRGGIMCVGQQDREGNVGILTDDMTCVVRQQRFAFVATVCEDNTRTFPRRALSPVRKG
jgi:hypothetical protein